MIKPDKVLIFFPKKEISGYKMKLGVPKSHWPSYYTNYTFNYLEEDDNYLYIYSLKALKVFARSINSTLDIKPTKVRTKVDLLWTVLQNQSLDAFAAMILDTPSCNFLYLYLLEKIKFVF